MKKIGSFVVCVMATAFILHAAGAYKIVARYPVPGNGGFDYITLDGAARRIYVSHATQVDVVEADSGKLVGTIGDTPGVHGIAIASAAQHGFTSNGREDKVSMFDLSTLKLIKKIDVGKGPDGIYFNAATQRVFTNNHGTHDITALDSVKGEVVGTVKLEGDGEQAVLGKDGLIYVNSENTAEVVAFDPKSLEVKKRFPVGVAKTPTGLAYDEKTNRLFIGTRAEPKMVVMDAANGKVIASFPIGTGVDWAVFDPESRSVFMSCGEGVLNVFAQKSADQYEAAQTVKTQSGAKTMAFDAKTKRIFLPSVEYDETPNADPKKAPARSVRSGSFNVLVVSQ